MMGKDVCVFKTAMGGTKALYSILTSDFSGPDLGYISITVQKLWFNLSWILLEYMLHVLRPGLQMLPIPSFYSKGAETRARSMWSEIPAILLSFLPFFLPALLRIPRQLVRLTLVKFLRTSAMIVSKKILTPVPDSEMGIFQVRRRYGARIRRERPWRPSTFYIYQKTTKSSQTGKPARCSGTLRRVTGGGG